MSDLPAWALERARYIIADSIILNTNTKMEIQRGDMDDIFRELLPFARALVAERERAAKIVEAKRGSVPDWLESDMAKINAYTPVEVSRATSKVLIEQLAAAIRKGE